MKRKLKTTEKRNGFVEIYGARVMKRRMAAAEEADLYKEDAGWRIGCHGDMEAGAGWNLRLKTSHQVQ